MEFIRDGALACDEKGIITYVGERAALPRGATGTEAALIIPPMLDAHIHIPQHPIRGRFMEDVEAHPQQGRLIAGLNRNVFPTEARCTDDDYTRRVVQSFLADTLAKGVIGGAAYMTVHPRAVRIALETLPGSWSVGLVLMNMNCPEYLRTSEQTLEEDVRGLAEEFGERFILTDRFAVAVDTPLRTRAVRLADELGLRMQTHLNEQIAEKRFVEEVLYPQYESYTDVYLRDGLLDRQPILAHCVRMSEEEFQIVAQHLGVIAHCPTSNTLLGSGIMPLDRVSASGLPYALCTDVGASPTTSLLAEMAQFLKVHAAIEPKLATPSEALLSCTLRAGQILKLHSSDACFQMGNPMSFVEVDCDPLPKTDNANEAIQLGLLGLSEQQLDSYRRGPHADAMDCLQRLGLDQCDELTLLESDTRQTCDRLGNRVRRVVVVGEELYRRRDSA